PASTGPASTGTADETVITVTAATTRPVQLRFAGLPSPHDALAALDAAGPCWHDDAHGSPRWRAAVTRRLVLEVPGEPAATAAPPRPGRPGAGRPGDPPPRAAARDHQRRPRRRTAGARPVPAHLPAGAGLARREEGLRRRRLRCLHGARRRAARAQLHLPGV